MKIVEIHWEKRIDNLSSSSRLFYDLKQSNITFFSINGMP